MADAAPPAASLLPLARQVLDLVGAATLTLTGADVVLTITRTTAPQSAAPELVEPDERSGSRCGTDILATLREAGHRCTTMRLLAELSLRGREWSERSVAGWLSRMVQEGTLTNDRTARPAGYGLPEWEERSDA